MRSIKLHKLLDLVGIIPSLDLIDHEINNISFNSKEVQKGTLFLGMPGLNVDGGKFCIEAITRHGPWKGGWLTLKRLSRCHPLTPCGCDPVPD